MSRTGFGDLDPSLRAHLLPDKVLGENRQQSFRRDGLLGARMQRRGQRFREIGQQIVPGPVGCRLVSDRNVFAY